MCDQKALKRALDVVIATVGLLLAFPLMALIAVGIRLTSAGPILYRGTRAGLNGVPFKILKFRTMVPDAESLGGSATASDDNRITFVGSWLRRFKFDELPQLINVLKGEMSLVGPRPEVFRYVEKYDERDRRVLSVPPGLTDWASLWDIDEGEALKGRANPEEAYSRQILPVKLQLQHYYIDHFSITQDIRIMAYTMVRIFFNSWAPPRLQDAMNEVAHSLPMDCSAEER